MRKLLLLFCLFCGLTCSSQTIYGTASYYGPGFHGKKTASGQIYNMNKMTCAHKTLPFGTKLKVTNTSNNKVIYTTVTDRGPYKHGRIIDLSLRCAQELDFIDKGITSVIVEVMSYISDSKKKNIIKNNIVFKDKNYEYSFINDTNICKYHLDHSIYTLNKLWEPKY